MKSSHQFEREKESQGGHKPGQIPRAQGPPAGGRTGSHEPPPIKVRHAAPGNDLVTDLQEDMPAPAEPEHHREIPQYEINKEVRREFHDKAYKMT